MANYQQVMNQGEKLLIAAEISRDPVTHARVSNKLQELKIRWLAIQRDTETKKLAIAELMPETKILQEEKSQVTLEITAQLAALEREVSHVFYLKLDRYYPQPMGLNSRIADKVTDIVH
uniref:Uncharacterized protein n=1 Tax=Biomphalaria glabrata TaxID=6526 RepID=A0A2C9LE43_BIOGL